MSNFPSLKDLDISYHICSLTQHPYLAQPDLTSCSALIAVLKVLKGLVIRCDIINFSYRFWRT